MNEQPAAQTEKKDRKTGQSLGWVWLAVAFIGISVLFFGFSEITEQMTLINQSIQANTQAVLNQGHILIDIQHSLQQLIVQIKDSVHEIIQAI